MGDQADQKTRRQSFMIKPNNSVLASAPDQRDIGGSDSIMADMADGHIKSSVPSRLESLHTADAAHPLALASLPQERSSADHHGSMERVRSIASRASKAVTVSSIVSRILGGEGVHEVAFPNQTGHKTPKRPKQPNYIRTTNYTLLTFLPLNLFRQIFTRYYNAYFTVAALTTISGNAALNWWSQVIPLVVVLTVTALKDAYEDIMRYKADRLANNRKHTVLRQGSQVEVPAKQIAVGDLLFLKRGEKVPADGVLISSETDDGTCFIETAELDGETNLKRKVGLLDVALYNTDERVAQLSGSLHCDLPNENLNAFNGKLMLHRFQGPLNADGNLTSPPLSAGPHSTGPSAVNRGTSLLRRARLSKEDVSSAHTESAGWSPVDRVRSSLSLGKRLSRVRIDPEATTFAVSMNQFIPRGSVIRNVAFCYILVVYVGHDTKIMRNLKKSRTKASRLERELNYLVLGIFLYNIFLIVSSMILEYKQWDKWRSMAQSVIASSDNQQWYFADNGWLTTSTASHIGTSFLSFFSLYTYVIPISLFVTMEIVRFLQGQWMMWDNEMRAYRVNELTGEIDQIPMRANNTNLNEELGSVDYIFSDKTGTLTQNKMTADKWFIDGTIYDERAEPGCIVKVIESSNVPAGSISKTPNDCAKVLDKFLKSLVLCNTAIPSPHEKTGKTVYESQSPDESALLIGTEQNKALLKSREKGNVTIEVRGKTEVYALLNTLEFSSDRKRMTVIVRAPSREILMICKGADNIVFQRLSKNALVNSPEELAAAQKALDSFASTGLRTLAVAGRVISESEYESFRAKYSEAEQSLENRDQRINDVAETVERDMELYGCTAIEDELQDDVPETIAFLRKCDIKLWLLTGDKLETAINIGFSSQFIDHEMRLFVLGEQDVDNSKNLLEQWINEIAQDSRRSTRVRNLTPGSKVHDSSAVEHGPVDDEESDGAKKYGLVIVGIALSKIWDEKIEMKLLELGQKCHSVICCRVTPLQKANVVKLVKDNTKSITLAIGDGANDVSMIQSASIGIGIIGREGSQAQRASDYAFGEFKFLARLLAVHGRYSYLRFSKLIYFSFYKNFALITVQWIYNFYNSWSASLVFDEIFMTLYNVVFTSIPPVILALFEKDVSPQKIGEYARLYTEVRAKVYWKWQHFVMWILYASITAIILFFFVIKSIGEGDISGSGYVIGYAVQALIFSNVILLTVLLQFALIVRYWVWFTIGSIVLCIVINIAVMFLLSAFTFATAQNAVFIVHSVGEYYLLSILVPIACTVIYFTFNYCKRVYFPNDADIIAEEEKLESKFKKFDEESHHDNLQNTFNPVVNSSVERQEASAVPVAAMEEIHRPPDAHSVHNPLGVRDGPTSIIIPARSSSSTQVHEATSNSRSDQASHYSDHDDASNHQVQRVQSFAPQISPLQLSPFEVDARDLEHEEKSSRISNIHGANFQSSET